MNFEDQLTALNKWASVNRTDCQLGGAYEQADNFQMVIALIELTRSHRALISKHEEVIRAFEVEIARLESLVHRG